MLRNWIFVSVIIIICEFTLRLIGFCSAPLYEENRNFEYIVARNQDILRFGKHYLVNNYHQRSDNLCPDKVKILFVGDSVINGGVLTDHDDLATTILTRETNYQCLNISCGSWGPDNVASYIDEFGTFGAKKLILICSSHDAHDNMEFSSVVGKHPSYPKKQYQLAIFELFCRYILPKFNNVEGLSNEGIAKNGVGFNSGFDALLKQSRKHGFDFILYLHPEINELLSKKYNSQGKEILSWARENKVSVIQGIDFDFVREDYRDNIHINESGQEKIAKLFKNKL
jgi:hypothetical protein